MLPSLQQESSLILFTLLFLISTLQQVLKNDSVKMMPAAWLLIMFWTSLQVNFSTVAPVWQFKNRSQAQSKKSWLVRVIKRTKIFEYKVTDLLKIIWIIFFFGTEYLLLYQEMGEQWVFSIHNKNKNKLSVFD